jgi:hypothetical protein
LQHTPDHACKIICFEFDIFASQIFELEEKDPNPPPPPEDGSEPEPPKPIIIQVWWVLWELSISNSNSWALHWRQAPSTLGRQQQQ